MTSNDAPATSTQPKRGSFISRLFHKKQPSDAADAPAQPSRSGSFGRFTLSKSPNAEKNSNRGEDLKQQGGTDWRGKPRGGDYGGLM